MQQFLTNESSGIPGKLTGFELTHNTLKRLNEFDITISAKLVLVFLTTFYNEKKNGAVVFPSIQYIADTLGIGKTAVKQAIKDLVTGGLLLKTKMNKIGNHNKYCLILSSLNPTVKQTKNDSFKQPKSDCFMNRTNKSEQINEQATNVVVFQKKETVKEAQVPDFIKNNKSIKNPCAYWASLTPEIQAELTKKDMEVQAVAQKKLEEKQKKEQLRIAEVQEREYYKSLSLSEKYTKEQATALINAMPAEIRKISKIAKELTELYQLHT